MMNNLPSFAVVFMLLLFGSCKKQAVITTGVAGLESVKPFPDQVYALQALSEEILAVQLIGTAGFSITLDGGQSWENIDGPNADTLNKLVVLDAGHFFGRFHGTVYETTDGGTNWLNRGDFVSVGKDESGNVYAYREAFGQPTIYKYNSLSQSFSNYHIIGDLEYGFYDSYDIKDVKFTGNYAVFLSENWQGDNVYHNAWNLSSNSLKDFNEHDYSEVMAQGDELYYMHVGYLFSDDFSISFGNPNYPLTDFTAGNGSMLLFSDSITFTNYFSENYTTSKTWEPLYDAKVNLVNETFTHGVLVSSSKAFIVSDDDELYLLNLAL